MQTGRSRRRGDAEAVESHFGERCRIGIGVNSGLVLVGAIGGGELRELGVVGDPVNVAARVQDATRELGVPLLVTEATVPCSRGARPAGGTWDAGAQGQGRARRRLRLRAS